MGCARRGPTGNGLAAYLLQRGEAVLLGSVWPWLSPAPRCRLGCARRPRRRLRAATERRGLARTAGRPPSPRNRSTRPTRCPSASAHDVSGSATSGAERCIVAALSVGGCFAYAVRVATLGQSRVASQRLGVLALAAALAWAPEGGAEVRVERLLDRPIIEPATHPSIGENIQGPSLVRVPDWVAAPLGAYYLYFADHKGRYIRLAYADALTGPWQVHEPGSLRLEASRFLTEPHRPNARRLPLHACGWRHLASSRNGPRRARRSSRPSSAAAKAACYIQRCTKSPRRTLLRRMSWSTTSGNAS